MICNTWHLCIPPLLTLLDDTSTFIRARGLLVLHEMLDKIPTRVLQQTGLGEVFEDAVMPTLLFLPSLTPVEDSIMVLKPAYAALFQLGEVRFPTREERYDKMRFFDRIMRQGVLQAFLHSRENTKIAELLLHELITLVQRMGIHAVKHLKVCHPPHKSTLVTEHLM